MRFISGSIVVRPGLKLAVGAEEARAVLEGSSLLRRRGDGSFLLAERISRLFHGSTAPAHYATLFYGCDRAAASELVYVNCGHPPAMLQRQGAGDAICCGATGLPAGLFPPAQVEEVRLPVRAGDRLIISSDGITEADMGLDDRTQLIVSFG